MANSSGSMEQMYCWKLTFGAKEESLIEFKVAQMSLSKTTKPKQMEKRSEVGLLCEDKCARELTCRGG